MAEQKKIIKIYSLGHPLVATELISLIGDKYHHALPFDFNLTDDIKEASLVAWDGVISVKMNRLLPEIQQQLKGKVLLLLGESQTSFSGHPLVKLFDFSEIKTIQLTGWSVIPEEFLAALEVCYQKSLHV